MLYNKFRPITFSEMKGQEVNRTILKNQIKDDKIVHSYIFHGLHGSGKTTAAKIFARAINCLHPINGEPCNKCESCIEFKEGRNPDIYEIDSASNNKVEDVAKIKDILKYSPQRKKKVFILDEAHMLSKAAWNSLLTTIEDAPKNVVLIFCSTELQKFPETILSRCMKLSFTSISENDILDNLIKICKEEHLNFEEKGLKLLSKLSNGSMRDALSHLEKCIAFGDLTELNVSNLLGIVDQANIFEILKQTMLGNIENSIKIIDDLFFLGKDMYSLAQNIVEGLRDIYIYNLTKNDSLITKDLEYVSAFKINTIYVGKAINRFYELLDTLRKTDNKKVIIEISIMEISTLFKNSECEISDFNFSLKNIKKDNRIINKKEKNILNKEILDEVSVTLKNKETNYEKEINYHDYLILKVDLLKTFDINDPQLKILLNAKIYCSKNAFNIKSPEISKLNQVEISNKIRDLSNKELNIIFKE